MSEHTTSDYTFGAPVVMIAADAAIGDALAAATGWAITRIDWADAEARLARQVGIGLLLVEATGANDAAVAALLPHVDALARAGETAAVVAFDVPQLDLVTAHLLGGPVELLCDPTVADRVGAMTLALGAHRSGRAHDVTREAEAARLRRLNEEVARIAETLARLSRDSASPRPTSFGDRPLGYGAMPSAASAGPATSPGEIRAAIRARRLRDKIIPGGLFEDPAWDMLLDLAAADLEHAQVSVSSLCIAAAVAPTTALRWIGKLTDAGLLERRADPFDRRRAFLRLSDRGRAGMHRYLAMVKEEGLVIA